MYEQSTELVKERKERESSAMPSQHPLISSAALHLKGADAFVYLSAAKLGLSPKAFTLVSVG
jgi:hypothetical protein